MKRAGRKRAAGGRSAAKEQIYRPISWLPMVAEMMEGQLEQARDQYDSLLPARTRPHVLDDATVDRVIRLYEESLDLLPACERQLAHWLAEPIIEEQRREVTRLQRLVPPYRDLVEKILALARELKQGTIDRILAMPEEGLAVKTLTGELPHAELDEEELAKLRALGIEPPSDVPALATVGRVLADACRKGEIPPSVKDHAELARLVDGWLDQARRRLGAARERGEAGVELRALEEAVLELAAARRRLVY